MDENFTESTCMPLYQLHGIRTTSSVASRRTLHIDFESNTWHAGLRLTCVKFLWISTLASRRISARSIVPAASVIKVVIRSLVLRPRESGCLWCTRHKTTRNKRYMHAVSRTSFCCVYVYSIYMTNELVHLNCYFWSSYVPYILAKLTMHAIIN